MKEARLVVTGFLTIPDSIVPVRKELERRLVEEFGGFLLYPAAGGWKDSADGAVRTMECAIYDFAVHEWASRDGHLLRLAAWLRDATKQKSVYLRDPWRDEVLIV